MITMHDIDIMEITIRLFIAAAIGAAIGFERENNHQAAGLRTNIIVCVAACILTIIQLEISLSIIRRGLENPDLQPMLNTDFSRITAQIVSGIGFLGAGAIITTKMDTVSGLTTAATIWGVAGLGIAVGMGYYYLSVIGALILLIVLYVLKRVFHTGETYHLVITVTEREAVKKFNNLFEHNNMQTRDIDFKMEQTSEGKIFHFTYKIFIPLSINRNDLIDEFLSLSDSILSISFED